MYSGTSGSAARDEGAIAVLEFGSPNLGTVFSQVILRGKPMKNGKVAETNYIWPSPWFLSNYFYRHLKSIDFNLHQRLRKPIAKALYPLLETGWYASGGKPYAKSYRDLCQEFLLADRRHISRIKEQLDPSHRELVRERFLDRWEYRTAAHQGDYIMTYWPGQKFFEDQQAREIRRRLAEQLTRKPEELANPEQATLNGAEQALLDEILAVCGDMGNQAAYQKVIREHPEGLLWMAISETRQASRPEHAFPIGRGGRWPSIRLRHACSDGGIRLPFRARVD